MISNPIYGKIKNGNQTTNQYSSDQFSMAIFLQRALNLGENEDFTNKMGVFRGFKMVYSAKKGYKPVNMGILTQ